MKSYKQFKPFQIRWKEKMYQGNTHYLTRWTFLFFGYSIRIHHWIASDVGPHFHDHGCDFLSFLFKGSYINCTPDGNKNIKAPSIWYAKGDKKHRLEIPSEGAWTLLLCSRQYRNGGFLLIIIYGDLYDIFINLGNEFDIGLICGIIIEYE
jgi:hypothetical protein